MRASKFTQTIIDLRARNYQYQTDTTTPIFMNTTTANYKALSISERIQLVEDIWDSIAKEAPVLMPLSSEDCEELHRRLAAHHNDPLSSIPWQQVRSRLFKENP